ncbi:hypothetical protein CK203_028415 [Vitis vinifera]|uniref:Uncharacterized protein n=1 Tax=Vitis vinifera TaxID=29760 RepID=A0A438J0A1_VITVI|nr:hypothetical protein CK203_028415 [Vitis vinifera]
MTSLACPLTCPPFNGDGAAGFDEGRGEGTRGGPGCVGGAIGASGEAFFSKLLHSASGSRKEGPHKPNGRRPGAPGVCRQHSPQEAAKGGSSWEHYIMKDLPIYKEVKEVDAEKRRALLDNREKRKNDGTLRKAPGQKRSAASPPRKALAKKRKLVKNAKGVKEPTPPKEFVLSPITHEAEVIIEEPVNPAPHSISSGPGHVTGLNHSGPPCRRLPVWLLWLRKLRP